MSTPTLRRAALLACLTLACSPQSRGTETTPTTSTASSTTSGADPCALEPDVPGECDNYHVGYYFDPTSQTCQRVDYGDCGTPVIPFETLAACRVACEGCETDCATSSGTSGG